MVKRGGLIITIFLLLGIFLFSSLVFAYGSTFDTAEELQFDGNGNTITKGTLLGNDVHYYSYSAYKGDNVKLTFIGAPSEGDNIHLHLKIYDLSFKELFSSNIYIASGVEERKEESSLSSWSGKRYIQLYIGAFNTAGGDYEVRITKTCKEGYSDELRKCEDGKWIEKSTRDFLTGEDVPVSECNGCIFSGYCYNIGQDFSSLDGTKKYCSIDNEIVSAKTAGKNCMESYECASPLTCAEGKCYDLGEVRDEETEDLREVRDEETGDTIYARDCKTKCIVDEICYGVGNRFKEGSGIASYCSVGKTAELQKEEKKSCSENYECFSNECSKGVCIDTINFIQSIVNWFKSIFSTAPPAPSSVCGNGIKEGAEECDDGNPVEGDGCGSSCTSVCTETDNRNEPAVRGTTKGIDIYNRYQEKTDLCVNSTRIKEYYCAVGSTSRFLEAEQTCTWGCADGACLATAPSAYS